MPAKFPRGGSRTFFSSKSIHGCSFLYTIAKKTVIMSEAVFVDVSLFHL